jgi:hypothetical protein
LKANRTQIDERLGKLGPALDDLEPKSEKLHLQDSATRDPAELARVRDGLQGLAKQAKESRQWLEKWSPVRPAQSLRDKGIALVDALIPFAEALDTQAGGVVVGDINDKRKTWRDARLEWSLAQTK